MQYRDIPELDSKGLRQFGLMLGGVLVLLFGLLLPWLWQWQQFPNLYWVGAGLACVFWAMLAPDSMVVVYHGWMRMALVIGNIVNTIILAFVFYIVITPMGLVMRMMGKDPMQRRLDKGLPSYRVISRVADRNHVERPY